MIWNPFGAKPGPARDEDRVWRTAQARLAAVVREAGEADPVLVVAHFRDTLEALERLFAAQGLRCRTFIDRIMGAALAKPSGIAAADGIALALAEALPAGAPAAGRDPEALVIVAEHHFVPARDEHVAAYCRALPLRTRLRFHESLDTPLLAAFMTDAMQRLLGQLGLPETECIEHAMVTRAIRNAQDKLAGAATGDRAADSAQAWARLNLPPG